MTKNAELRRPKPRRTDWSAFFLALLGGPFWGTLAAVLIALIPLALHTLLTGDDKANFILVPVFGIVFGAPFYLTLGAVAFYLTARADAGNPWVFALAGFVANLLIPLAMTLLAGLTNQPYLIETSTFFLLLGLACAPIYGWGFGSIYLNLTKGD